MGQQIGFTLVLLKIFLPLPRLFLQSSQDSYKKEIPKNVLIDDNAVFSFNRFKLIILVFVTYLNYIFF